MTSHVRHVATMIGVLAASVALAQDEGTLLTNWTAPPYWTPPPAAAQAAPDDQMQASAEGMTASAQSLSSSPFPFTAISPCRLADTRGNGFTGAYGPPALISGASRTFTVTGQCGIPSGAQAVSFNFTIVGMTTSGDLRVYPAGGSLPVVSTQNWTASTGAIANAAVVPLGSGGVTVHLDGPGSAQLIIDVNGYYASTLNGGEQLLITANTGAGAIRGVNALGDGVQGETAGGGSSGVYGNNTGGGKGVFGASTTGSGVGGQSTSGPGVGGVSTTGSGVYGATAGVSGQTGAAGVWGNSHDYFGVWGTSVAGDGVHGQSTTASGVYGLSAHAGVWGDSTGFDGVHGHTTVGTASGVAGFNDSTGAGTFGSSASGDGVFGSGLTGVHGTSALGWGVYGSSTGSDGVHADTTSDSAAGVAGIAINNGFGVYGSTTNGNGVEGIAVGQDQSAQGVHAVGTSFLNCLTLCTPSTTGSLSLLADGNAHFNDWVTIYGGLTVVAFKNFVTPHPTDPTKQIAFVSLEGPESGTYFRGTGHLVGGYAEIPVPESFRLVTSEQGLTVVATPMGSAASIYCVSKSLDRIVFQGSADVDFDYMVNGVRAGYENYTPIQNNVAFVPRSASDTTLTRLTGETARRLKANGILNDDGTLNLETAHRLGWDQRPGWNRVPLTPAAETKSAPTSN